MDNHSDYLEDIRVIKKVMEESSRFLSLSGLAGVFAGIIALAGAALAVIFFMNGKILLRNDFFLDMSPEELLTLKINILILALVILVLAVGLSFWLSYRNAVKKGIKIWTPVSKRLLVSLLVPLATGGFLILIFFMQNNWQLIIPSMLIFYGLALVGAGKFTYNDIFYLGLAEITAGMIAALIPAYGIILWCAGFGLLHILYGLIMYRKYER